MRKFVAILVLATPLAACTAAPPALIPAEACVVIDAAGNYVCGEPGTLPEPWPGIGTTNGEVPRTEPQF